MEAGWLSTVAEPLVQLSAPQDDPAPHYSRAADAVVATHAITFGRHGWPLPSVEKLLLDKTLQARFFAAALLAGRVLTALEGWSTFQKFSCSIFLSPQVVRICEARSASVTCCAVSALLEAVQIKSTPSDSADAALALELCRAAGCAGGVSGQGGGS